MIKNIFKDEQIAQLKSILEVSRNVVLTCHKSPDGDAVGSTMGFCQVLKQMGKNARVAVPNTPPDNLRFLPQADTMLCADVAEEQELTRLFDEADLLLCMDYNDVKRIQSLTSYVEQSSAKKVLIDHHMYPKHFCDLEFSFPEMSSTCELAYRLVMAMNLEDKVGKLGASYFYMGLVTDTGNFAYNSSNPETFEIAASLLGYGIDKNGIYNRAFNTQKENSIRLQSYALQHSMKVKREYGVALITISQETLRRYYYTNGDTEGLVNVPLKIPEVFCSVFMREDESCIKISMRSQGEFSVRDLCERYFGGGGHLNASAGEFYGTLEEAVNMFYVMLLKEKNNFLEYKEKYINRK